MIEKIPTHIGIIPDGNRRWATSRGLPSVFGHKKGYQRLTSIAKACLKRKIPILTVWVFSTENWKRSSEEVGYLMDLFRFFTKVWLKDAHQLGMKIRHLGSLDQLPNDLKELIKQAVQKTKRNTKMTLNIALNYGGQDEIVRAVKKLIQKQITADKVDFDQITEALDTSGLPEPDLVVRTSGEHRLSGFLPFQAAYAELYFTEKHWPDFTVKELDKALAEYARRDRRTGK